MFTDAQELLSWLPPFDESVRSAAAADPLVTGTLQVYVSLQTSLP